MSMDLKETSCSLPLNQLVLFTFIKNVTLYSLQILNLIKRTTTSIKAFEGCHQTSTAGNCFDAFVASNLG